MGIHAHDRVDQQGEWDGHGNQMGDHRGRGVQRWRGRDAKVVSD